MALPVLAQIYALSAGVGCLTVLFSALTGAMHHGGVHHGHGHAGDAGHAGHGHSGHSHSHGHSHGHGQSHGHTQGHGHDTGDQRSSAGLVRVNKQHVAVKEDEPGLGVALLTWLNPNTIAAFATWFGSIGLILWRGFSLPLFSTLPLAIIGGALGAKFMLAFVGLIGSKMYQSHTFTQQDVIGLQAEVTVPVTNQGTGEVVYVVGGTRHTSSAKPNKPEVHLPRGAKAIICDVRDDVAYIEPWGEDELALTAPGEA
jgi:hypothetical protein